MRSAVLLCLCAALGMAQSPPRASAVFVAAPSSQILAHDSAQLSAVAYDGNGNSIPSAVFTWASSDKSVITVDATGNITAVGLGWSDITANTTGASGAVRLQVLPLAINLNPQNPTLRTGDSLQFTADVLDVNGVPMQGVNLGWRVLGVNGGGTNFAGIDQTGTLYTYGFGKFYVEAYFNYTAGTGPFLPRFYANSLVTVLQAGSFQQTRLADSGAVRQNFLLRQRRGLLNVNDAGSIAYVGWLEGFAPAALMWENGALRSVAAGSTPGDMPNSLLIDVNDLAINNNGEVSAQAIMVSPRNVLLFGASDGTSHMILFDGSSGGGVQNIRNYATTRFGLNDNSVTMFRADYFDTGSTVNRNGLFTTTSNGFVTLQVPAGTNLPGLGTTYTFDRDFGLDNDGNLYFYATNSPQRALFQLSAADYQIRRVIGTGDMVNGSAVISLGNVAVGKNGQFATMIYNGQANYALLWNGNIAKSAQTPVGYVANIWNVSGAGETVFVNSINGISALFRWNGTAVKPVFAIGAPSPVGEPYIQFDSAGITAKGEVIAQARTANNLLMVVNSGAGTGAKPSIVFQAGTPVAATAGPAFYYFVNGSHSGNPMIKTGWFYYDVMEWNSGALLPRFVNGDRMPDGWFYEASGDIRRNADGDVFLTTDQSLTQVAVSGVSKLLAHFPQRVTGGLLNTGFQVNANTNGTVVIVGGTNFGPQHLSLVKNGSATPVAWLNGPANYRTNAPGGGYFLSSSDITADENGVVYANLRVSGGADGLFAYQQGAWSALLHVGDPFDNNFVTGINSIRAAGSAIYAHITITNNQNRIAVYRDGQWTDLIKIGDSMPNSGLVTSVSATFDVNRKGAIAALVGGTGGFTYVTYLKGTDEYLAADNVYPLNTGELIVSFFNITINDDGKIFATALNNQDQTVLYEFDPQF